MAEALKPDLTLLDIGLPNLNGIEAAKRIRQIVPGSRIVCLTQNSDEDIMRTALKPGPRDMSSRQVPEPKSCLRWLVVLGGSGFVSGIKRGRVLKRWDV